MTLTLTPQEQTNLDEIRRAGGFRTDEDAVRGALFWFGRFLDIEVPADVFALSPFAPPRPETIDQPDLFGEWVP
jgi:hypothetical protein